MTLNWIPIDERVPEDDNYVLLSFSNFGVPKVGRYEDGKFYAGDDDSPLIDVGVVVNAWMPLPKCYGYETNNNI